MAKGCANYRIVVATTIKNKQYENVRISGGSGSAIEEFHISAILKPKESHFKQ